MRNHLFNTDKINYIMGRKKKKPECILCAIRDDHPDVDKLIVARTQLSIVSVNLFPFNPGHLMIYPVRHVEDLQELTEKEAMDMHNLLVQSVDILKREYNPSGFNVGYNLGKFSGASVSHIHQHVVPRYENEVGFLDVLSGTRVVVIDPREVVKLLQDKFLEKK